jgi:hypothetical protein
MSTDRPIDWHVNEPRGDGFFRWGYSGEELIAEWTGFLTLRATRGGELIDLQAAPGATEDLVEKARRGVATAFLRAQKNQVSLHASAVALGRRAIVCVGSSGQGKSTMAEAICRRSGALLLADDTAGIDAPPGGGIRVLPSESVVWLVTEDPARKASVPVPRAADAPTDLALIVSLAFDDAAASLDIRDLHGGDAVAALLPSLLRFETTPDLWLRELEIVGRLVSACRVVQATRSRSVTGDATAEALLALFESETP